MSEQQSKKNFERNTKDFRKKIFKKLIFEKTELKLSLSGADAANAQ